MTITAPTKTKITAKMFREPLLRALGRLSGFTAEVPVHCSDTYPAVMGLSGITDVNAHGAYAVTGQPYVVLWIQQAFRILEKAGHGTKARSKQWMLTATGVAVAGRLDGVASAPVVTAPVTTIVPAVPVPVVVSAPTPVTVLTGVSAMFLTGHDETTYDSDPYIRSLAVALTPCFGFWSNHAAAICARCPLAGACRNFQFGTMSRIAAEFAAEDRALEDAKVVPATTILTVVPAAPITKTSSRRTEELDFDGVEMIDIPEESVCRCCDVPIAKGTLCYWFSPANQGDSGFLVHEHHKDEDIGF